MSGRGGAYVGERADGEAFPAESSGAELVVATTASGDTIRFLPLEEDPLPRAPLRWIRSAASTGGGALSGAIASLGGTVSGAAASWAASSRKRPVAVGPGSDKWVQGDSVTHCGICEVEFSAAHKHVTRRHCRRCGEVFCYTCTYDKVGLRQPGAGCLPWTGATTNLHVCSACYDCVPPPADGLRRCRFCHQKVRCPPHPHPPAPPRPAPPPALARSTPTPHRHPGCQVPPPAPAHPLTHSSRRSSQVRTSYFAAHTSVCLEDQYARAQFAPKQLAAFGGSTAAAAA